MNRFKLIAGPCLIESYENAFEIAETVHNICEKYNIEFIFKGSYRKANRTKLESFSSIGDMEALDIIKRTGNYFNIETLTDAHESPEPKMAANYVDYIQIPAFLCRQTDLLIAAGKTGKKINIKKGQFASPEDMGFAIEKVKSTGNNNIFLTERGTTFGYGSLIVDATAIYRLKRHGYPVIMDCTHATGKAVKPCGNTKLNEILALSAVASGADGLFIETHPEPKKALSDTHMMLKLNELDDIIAKVVKIRDAIIE